MTTMTDWRGYLIEEGAQVLYSATEGSSARMVEAEVDEILADGRVWVNRIRQTGRSTEHPSEEIMGRKRVLITDSYKLTVIG